MQFYNMMTCDGFTREIGGGCSLAWAAAVIIFIVIAVARKWLFEEVLQQDFNFIAGEVVGIFSYMIAVAFIGAPKWCLLIGIVLGLLAGYFAPMIMGGGDSGGGASEF